MTGARQRRSGWRAARVSSTRPTTVLTGASNSCLRIRLRNGDDFAHRLDERIERLLRFGLSRLDHQAFRNEQRKIDGRRHEPAVEQRFGDVERADAGFFLEPLGRRDELVTADFGIRRVEKLGDLYAQVVGVQYRELRDALEAFFAVRVDVGERADGVGEVRPERTHRSDRFGAVEVQMKTHSVAGRRVRIGIRRRASRRRPASADSRPSARPRRPDRGRRRRRRAEW